MKVVRTHLIDAFIASHKDSAASLKVWLSVTRASDWSNIVEVRKSFPHADAAGTCTVFNIKGNHYRLVTRIDYAAKIVIVKHVMTHADYSKDKWKKDCKT